ncbi:hypothetical protein GCM10010341_77190 [Streptomyces noursei]|nr:hypothetical protein GCM10010341_77190 [Streptomyces noursei]
MVVRALTLRDLWFRRLPTARTLLRTDEQRRRIDGRGGHEPLRARPGEPEVGGGDGDFGCDPGNFHGVPRGLSVASMGDPGHATYVTYEPA